MGFYINQQMMLYNMLGMLVKKKSNFLYSTLTSRVNDNKMVQEVVR